VDFFFGERRLPTRFLKRGRERAPLSLLSLLSLLVSKR
jgi:hypothetical protein